MSAFDEALGIGKTEEKPPEGTEQEQASTVEQPPAKKLKMHEHSPEFLQYAEEQRRQAGGKA